jgi:hypothetical protein
MLFNKNAWDINLYVFQWHKIILDCVKLYNYDYDINFHSNNEFYEIYLMIIIRLFGSLNEWIILSDKIKMKRAVGVKKVIPKATPVPLPHCKLQTYHQASTKWVQFPDYGAC